ncbi:MaoC/PaaZ C-terminal domain-containing protein [Pseudoalteromonas rubra]|nr:MaoC/PaaZ C-terminal domain-containing protein [Pseudoalteromonas rubra]
MSDNSTLLIEPEALPNTIGLLGRASCKRTIATGAPLLPVTVLKCQGMRVSEQKLRQFNSVIGWNKSEQLPPTFVHIMAFPLQMSLVLEESFPFALMGLVHIKNTISQLRPIHINESLDIKCYSSDLISHKRGWQFTLNTEAYVGDELVWRSASTNLLRQEVQTIARGNMPALRKPIEPKGATENWTLANNLGRNYAKVSGDYNLIHLYPLTAKLYGFQRHIIHGMWSKGRVLSALSDVLPPAFEAHVKFKNPILLPAEIIFSHQSEQNQGKFSMYSNNLLQQHLTGHWLSL